jgi:hypothetical protein
MFLSHKPLETRINNSPPQLAGVSCYFLLSEISLGKLALQRRRKKNKRFLIRIGFD